MNGNASEEEAGAVGTRLDDLRRAFPPGAEPPFRTPVGALVAIAVRRGRRRRIATFSAKAVLGGVPVIGAVAMFAGLWPQTIHQALSPVPSSSGALSSPSGALSSPSGAVSKAAGCTAAQLSGRVFRAGSQTSAPFTEIVLTNRGPGSCELSGYPKLTAWGSTGNAPSARLVTVLTQSSTYEIPDPGPTKVFIRRGGSAWFAVGTGTAYGSPLLTLDRVSIEMGSRAGVQTSHVTIPLRMLADGPPGKAIPITVTAFAPGVPAPQ